MLRGGCALSMCVEGYLGKTGDVDKQSPMQRFGAEGDSRTLRCGHSSASECTNAVLPETAKGTEARQRCWEGRGSSDWS